MRAVVRWLVNVILTAGLYAFLVFTAGMLWLLNVVH
jgi:hypothetical protein